MVVIRTFWLLYPQGHSLWNSLRTVWVGPEHVWALWNKETALGIEPRIVALETRSIVTIPTELSGLRD
jgi:hypothetical protein